MNMRIKVIRMIDLVSTFVGTFFDICLLIYYIKDRAVKVNKMVFFVCFISCTFINVLINILPFSFLIKLILKNSYSNLLDIHRIRRYIHFRFFKNNSYFFNVVRRFGNFDFADCDALHRYI